MSAPAHSPADPLTNYRLEMMEKAIAGLTENMAKLTSIEVKYHENRDAQLRAFAMIDKLDGRVTAIEAEIPTLKLVRAWVIAGSTSTIGIFAVYLIRTVLPQ